MNKTLCKTLWWMLPLFGLIAGCSKGGFGINSSIGIDLPYFKPSSSAQFIPEGDAVDANCMSSGEMCLYFKNPVFQEQQLIAASNSSGLIAAQKFAAKLTNLDYSGSLKNANLDIKTSSGSRFPWNAIVESKASGSANSLYPSAANSYYWLNRANEYLAKTYPDDFTPTPMTVFIDDQFDGYSYETRSMHLSKDSKTALSAELLLILFGEAQAGLSSAGKIYEANPTNHEYCSGNVFGCCSSEMGCSRALLRGAGEVMLNMLMPSSAAGVGEFHRQSLTGQDVCGLGRKLDNFKTTFFNQVNTLCAGRPGSTLALGMIYASIWREVRIAAAITPGTSAAQVDRVFLRHLTRLDGNDTFTTAATKIATICDELGFADLKDLFATEFSSR